MSIFSKKRIVGLIFSIALAFNFSYGCKDISRLCKRYIKKYQECKKEQLLSVEKRLSQNREAQPLLRKLRDKVEGSEWKNYYFKLCIKTPPSRETFRCVLNATCKELPNCVR